MLNTVLQSLTTIIINKRVRIDRLIDFYVDYLYCSPPHRSSCLPLCSKIYGMHSSRKSCSFFAYGINGFDIWKINLQALKLRLLLPDWTRLWSRWLWHLSFLMNNQQLNAKAKKLTFKPLKSRLMAFFANFNDVTRCS